MDCKTLKVVEPTNEQLRAEPGRYVPIPAGEVEAVKAMSTDERRAWLKARELANRKGRRQRKRLRKAGRAARKRMRAAQRRC